MKPLVDAERISGVFDRTVQASTHHDWNTLQERAQRLAVSCKGHVVTYCQRARLSRMPAP